MINFIIENNIHLLVAAGLFFSWLDEKGSQLDRIEEETWND